MPLSRRRPSPTTTAVLLGAAGAATLRALGARAALALLEHDVAALRAGDPGPLVGRYSRDARLRFPGSSSWGRDYRGREEIEGFLRRFLAAGLTGEIEEAVVSGPPWRQTIVIRFNDRALDAGGAEVYANRAIIFAHLRWGRIVDEEVYEDTERSLAFDAWLAAVRPEAAPADVSATAPAAR